LPVRQVRFQNFSIMIKKLILSLCGLLFVVLLFAQQTDCWPIFRGNPALEGVSASEFPNDPQLLWSFQAEDNFKASLVACEDLLIAGSLDGYLYAIDFNGNLKWKFQTGNAIEAPAVIFGDLVYVGDLDGTLFAINLESGTECWRFKADNQISGSPNWWSDGEESRILVGSYDYFLYCLDAETGTLKWKYESDNFINGAAAIATSKVYFGGCDGYLHVVDVLSGKGAIPGKGHQHLLRSGAKRI